MTTVVISQPMYLPWAGFLAQLSLADQLIWLDDAQFSKGSFTNRVQLRTGDGLGWLSIALQGKGSGQRICDLAPVQDDWLDRHRASLRNAHGKAPHFADLAPILDAVEGTEPLSEALIASSEALARAIGLTLPKAPRTLQMNMRGQGWQRVLDLVKSVGGTRYLTGMGARNYLDHQAFEDAGIEVLYMDYDVRPWPQGADFTPYVTALDLVANVDPADRKAHLNPRTKPWRAVV